MSNKLLDHLKTTESRDLTRERILHYSLLANVALLPIAPLIKKIHALDNERTLLEKQSGKTLMGENIANNAEVLLNRIRVKTQKINTAIEQGREIQAEIQKYTTKIEIELNKISEDRARTSELSTEPYILQYQEGDKIKSLAIASPAEITITTTALFLLTIQNKPELLDLLELDAENGEIIPSGKFNAEIDRIVLTDKKDPEFAKLYAELAESIPALLEEKPKSEPKAEIKATTEKKPQPVTLSSYSKTFVSSFEKQFDTLLGRLQNKPKDKRLEPSSSGKNWEHYHQQGDLMHEMIEGIQGMDDVHSERQLAVLTDFFSANFGSEIKDKKAFFAQGSVALSVSKLAKNGIEIPDGLLQETATSLSLNGDLGRLKFKTYDRKAVIDELENAPREERGTLREVGTNILLVCAKEDEAAKTTIADNIGTAAISSNPKDRRNALESCAQAGQSEGRMVHTRAG